MNLKQVDQFLKVIEQQVPGFRLTFKDETLLHKVLGWLLKPFNPRYMTNFTTTLGKTVSFPSRTWYEENPSRAFSILAHELVHLVDYQTHGVWFSLSYLLPQLLALPLLLAGVLGLVWSWWGLLPLVLGLLCLIPFPAPWRAKWEGRGYAMSMAVTYWASGAIPGAQKEMIAHNFYGPSYYFMMWSKSASMALLQEKEVAIVTHTLETEPVYALVREFMRENGLTWES